MAKRKTPKVKDLRPEKITDQQLEKLQETYGTDNINLQDGTISYPETNTENGEVNKKDQYR